MFGVDIHVFRAGTLSPLVVILGVASLQIECSLLSCLPPTPPHHLELSIGYSGHLEKPSAVLREKLNKRAAIKRIKSALIGAVSRSGSRIAVPILQEAKTSRRNIR
jgi:hypothetical protein